VSRTGLALLAAIVAILACPVDGVAQNGTTPGQVLTYSTIRSIGVEWDISGDANHNARVSVQYRVQGTPTWSAALPLVRVDYNGFNGLAGSVLFLDPDTTYEVKLDLLDPDGGAASRTVMVATRPLPALPTSGRTLHVVPGAGGGDGSAANPFKGIAAAQAVAQAGDTFLVHAGSYSGRTAFTKPGIDRNYLVWKGAGDGEALFVDGIDVSGSHVWLEGLTVRNLPYALMSKNCPTDVVLSRNVFINNHYSIYLQQGGSYWYIADNSITGDTPAATGSFSGEGIEMNQPFSACGSNGHTVAHNRITNVADGMSYPGTNVDIYGNDIFDTADDGIELDEGGANVRVWGNRIHNANHNGIAFQPQQGAPWYIIRNQIVINSESPFKFRTTDRFVLLHNTIVGWGKMICCNDDHLLRSFSRNNLWISANGGQMWWFPVGGDWRTDLDYDGFDWGSASAPFTYAGVSFPNLLGLAGVGLEKKGLRIDKNACFQTFNVPGNSPTTIPPQFMSLKAGCNAIDAGALLPNINDGFLGSAPDLGAYEFGQPLPVYGPRAVGDPPPPPPPPAPALKVYRAGAPITLDGLLGEWSGSDAASFSGSSSSASAALLWDDTNLYVAFQVNDTRLNATQTARDAGTLYLDDSIEIYLDTGNDRASAMQPDDYQLLVNLNNAQGDLRGTGTGKDAAWNAVWQSVVRLQGTLNNDGDTDSGYTVEIAIPWAQLGVTPTSGMVLGLDLAVDDSDPTSPTTYETFDWAGLAPNPYAQPSLWKQVQLVGTPPPLADTTPPSVAITVPSSGATVSGTVTVTANASDNVGVLGVQLRLDGAPLGAEDTTTPYTVAWNTTSALNGVHTLTAVARDGAGNTATSAPVVVTVGNADVTPPTVAITSPTSSPTFTTNTSSMALGGTASDNVGVTQVTWMNSRGGNGTATGTTSWTASGIGLQMGTNMLTVQARDAAGNTKVATLTATLTDTAPPAITITAPTSGATYTTSASSLTLAGTASDNVGVTQVTWMNSLGGNGTATGTTSWTAGVALQTGANVLTVQARDAAGNTATATLTVTLTDTFAFADDPLAAQSTMVKAVHILELRAAIDSVRVARGLTAFAWTDPTLTPGSTTARAVHVTELRSALNQAYQAAGQALPTYTDAPAGAAAIKATHLNEVRTAVRAL